jgi:EamA domain-containing membrane protein RarD
MKNKTLIATFAALGAQVIFGFSFMFTKIALGYASPLTVIADRYIGAFLGLSLVMLVKRQKMKTGKNLWDSLDGLQSIATARGYSNGWAWVRWNRMRG